MNEIYQVEGSTSRKVGYVDDAGEIYQLIGNTERMVGYVEKWTGIIHQYLDGADRVVGLGDGLGGARPINVWVKHHKGYVDLDGTQEIYRIGVFNKKIKVGYFNGFLVVQGSRSFIEGAALLLLL